MFFNSLIADSSAAGSSRKQAPRCAASIAPGPPPLAIRNFSRQSVAEMRATPL